MAETLFVQLGKGPTLYPANAYDAELMGGLHSGKPYKAVLTQPRSNKRNSLYWVLLTACVNNTVLGDRFPTTQRLHQALLMKTGHVGYVADINKPELHVIPDSTRFDKMDEGEFRAYFDRVLELLARELGCDPMTYLPEREAM